MTRRGTDWLFLGVHVPGVVLFAFIGAGLCVAFVILAAAVLGGQ